jgi:predicted RNA-binding protein with PIN domain
MRDLMRVLIDGYNLMHAMGLLRGPVGPNGLAKARAALIGRMASVHVETDRATLVLDARGALAGAEADESQGPIHIHYALTEEADDYIEREIAHDSAPARLVVVSSDRRLRDAARRRGCESWVCGEYIDWLDRTQKERMRPKRNEDEKPAGMSDIERKSWEELFSDAEHET